MSWLARFRFKIFAYISLLVLGFIATLRGNVGNDTLMVYEPMARSILAGVFRQGLMEPGLPLILKSLLLLSISPAIAVRILSIIFTILIFVFIAKADRTEFYYLLTFMFPLFFTYSMNIIRFGIASALLLLEFQYQRRNKWLGAVIFSVLSLIFHYSMLIPILLLYFFSFRAPSYRLSLYFVVIMVIVAVIVYFSEYYFYAKFTMYVEASRLPNITSGISKVLVNLVLIFGVFFSRLPATKKRLLIFVIFGLTTIFWVLTQYSYVGLRFLDLIAFSTPLLIIRVYDQSNLKIDSAFKLSLLVCGIIIVVFLYRNFLADYGGIQTATLSPFLPYHTIFQDGIWR
jgi:hypothetical protein